MKVPETFRGVDRDYTVIGELWEWEEKEADYKWFENLLESGDYEDDCPLVRIPNLDEWDGDPHSELCVEITRNPINLFGEYLIEKYGSGKGIYFLKMFCRRIGIFSSIERMMN